MENENNIASDNQKTDAIVDGDVVSKETKENSDVNELQKLLNDELKADKTLGKFKNVNDLAKSYINLQGLVGKKTIEKIVEKPVYIDREFNINDIKDYDVEYAQDDSIDSKVVSGFLNKAKELKLTKEQVHGVLGFCLDETENTYKPAEQKLLEDFQKQYSDTMGSNASRHIENMKSNMIKIYGEEEYNNMSVKEKIAVAKLVDKLYFNPQNNFREGNVFTETITEQDNKDIKSLAKEFFNKETTKERKAIINNYITKKYGEGNKFIE